MTTKTKRAAGLRLKTRELVPARKRGGDGGSAAESRLASTRTRSRVERSANVVASARPKQSRGESMDVNDTSDAAAPTKRQANAVLKSREDVPDAAADEATRVTEKNFVSRTNKRLAIGNQSPICSVPGDSASDRTPDSETTNARGKNNGGVSGRDTDTPIAANGSGECDTDAEGNCAAPVKTKRHANGSATPNTRMRGVSGNGEVVPDDEFDPAVSRTNKATGEGFFDTERTNAGRKHNAVGECGSDADLRSACRAIQELQRHRNAAVKMQVMGENRIVAHVATLLGYCSGLDEKDRKKRFNESRALIKQIVAESELTSEQEAIASRVRPLVLAAHAANRLIIATREAYEKEMESLAKTLPVVDLVKSVRGFGLMNLAIVVGEAGDLSNYANPAKLWKRLGLAPFKGAMGSTHRRKGGLSKDEWSEFGYSPRRRSQLHLLACNMVMQNDGEYRKRYDEAKATAKANHPDWTDGHAHAHAMLLALKRVIRDLWRAWRT